MKKLQIGMNIFKVKNSTTEETKTLEELFEMETEFLIQLSVFQSMQRLKHDLDFPNSYIAEGSNLFVSPN